MFKTIHLLKIFAVFIFVTSVWAQNPKELATGVQRAEKSTEILKQFAALGAASLPVEYLGKAKAVAVFPGLTRVNILLSELTIGNGIVAIREADGQWGVPAFLGLKAQDMNLKIAGKKTFDAVILFMDDEAVGWLKKGDVGFTSDGKRKMTLGPVIGGKGAEELMQAAKVLYYTLDKGQLIDTGLSTDSLFKAVAVVQDNNMNKSVFGLRTKQLFSAPEASIKIPKEIESYRAFLTENTPKSATSPEANQTTSNQ
jgi:lipid-binding SYLF domain-containing protein